MSARILQAYHPLDGAEVRNFDSAPVEVTPNCNKER